MGSKRKAETAKTSAPAAKRQRSALVELNNKDENGISQCFHKVSTLLYVSLAPVHTEEPEEGIKSQHLDPLIMSYFAPAGGVVIAHSNLQLFGQDVNNSTAGRKVAKIMYDSPFAFLWVSVDLLVWKPVQGDVVEGWINMQSPSHIGLLIHDTFNATIKGDSIPSDWTFVHNEQPQDEEEEEEEEEEGEGQQEQGKKSFKHSKNLGYWQDKHGNRISDKLKFTVKSFNVTGRTVSVQGTLLKPGEVKDITKYQTKDYSYDSPKADKKHIKFTPEPESTDAKEDAGEEDGEIKYGDNSDSDSDSD